MYLLIYCLKASKAGYWVGGAGEPGGVRGGGRGPKQGGGRDS